MAEQLTVGTHAGETDELWRQDVELLDMPAYPDDQWVAARLRELRRDPALAEV